jgi:hypothetical protein
MPEPLLLLDTDIFIVLSAAGLLDSIIRLLDFDAAHTRRLAALESQLTRGSGFREKYPREIREAALRSARIIPILTKRPQDAAVFQRLISHERIDDGEAFLFALLAEHKNWVLATGDKQAITTLATSPGLADIRNRVSGRVACLETVLPALLQQNGIETVAAAFNPLRAVNKTLSVVFSGGASTSESLCREYLDSYIRDLETQVGKDFLLKP